MRTMLSKIQNEHCISVSNLRKRYGKNIAYAVNDITFNVEYGTRNTHLKSCTGNGTFELRDGTAKSTASTMEKR
jgi:hypothetical protein